MGQRLGEALKEYENLRDTRTRMLERPLERIEDLRTARGLMLPEDVPGSGGADRPPSTGG
jgi:DNA anti-recombination protein RmuC